jgi:hypothetical protein
VRTLLTSHGGIAVQTDNQHITLPSRLLEDVEVSSVEKVERTVDRDKTLASRPQGRGERPQGAARNQTTIRIAAQQLVGGNSGGTEFADDDARGAVGEQDSRLMIGTSRERER